MPISVLATCQVDGEFLVDVRCVNVVADITEGDTAVIRCPLCAEMVYVKLQAHEFDQLVLADARLTLSL